MVDEKIPPYSSVVPITAKSAPTYQPSACAANGKPMQPSATPSTAHCGNFLLRLDITPSFPRASLRNPPRLGSAAACRMTCDVDLDLHPKVFNRAPAIVDYR